MPPVAGPVAPAIRSVRPVDAWGHAMRVSVESGTVNLVSAGPNGEYGDADDLTRDCAARAMCAA